MFRRFRKFRRHRFRLLHRRPHAQRPGYFVRSLGKRRRNPAEKYWPSFEEAKRIAREAGITSVRHYRQLRKDLGLPSAPHQIYADQWRGWADFLGKEKKYWPSFEEAKRIAKEAGITSVRHYLQLQKDLGLPSTPHQTYADQWRGWEDFLGKAEKKYWPSFEEAKRIAKEAEITSVRHYRQLQKDLGLPSNPRRTYADQWRGWADFLGKVGKKHWPSFEEAKRIAREAGITSLRHYQQLRKDLGLPSAPHQIYADQWRGWADFLGTHWPSFREAKRIVREMRITSLRHYQQLRKDLSLPSAPYQIYADQWRGWADFLGKTKRHLRRY